VTNTILAHEMDELQRIDQCYGAESRSVTARHEAYFELLSGKEQRLRQKVSQVEAVLFERDKVVLDRAAAGGIAALTSEDLHHICHRQRLMIKDGHVIKTNGKAVLEAKSDLSVMLFLGITCYGDCVYLLHTLTAIKATQKFIPPRNVEEGDATNPLVWNTAQTSEWLNKHGLTGLVGQFIRHKIAGDTLFVMDLDRFAVISSKIGADIPALRAQIAGLRDSLRPDDCKSSRYYWTFFFAILCGPWL
jgi:hypothetical protein